MKILVGHQIVQQALQVDLIPLECYGSVPGHCAIQVSFSCCLLADLSHQCCHPLVVACEDFARCYDQIAHCPASQACQCLMSTVFFTIQFMNFYLCTAYRDSATFYGGGLSQHPFQGICQGNGAGPAIWLALSLCLIHMLHHFGPPTRISSAVALTSIAMVCFIYVDNCNLFALAPLQTSTLSACYKICNTTWTSGKAVWKLPGEPYPSTSVHGAVYFITLKLGSGNYTHPKPTLPY